MKGITYSFLLLILNTELNNNIMTVIGTTNIKKSSPNPGLQGLLGNIICKIKNKINNTT